MHSTLILYTLMPILALGAPAKLNAALALTTTTDPVQVGGVVDKSCVPNPPGTPDPHPDTQFMSDCRSAVASILVSQTTYPGPPVSFGTCNLNFALTSANPKDPAPKDISVSRDFVVSAAMTAIQAMEASCNPSAAVHQGATTVLFQQPGNGEDALYGVITCAAAVVKG